MGPVQLDPANQLHRAGGGRPHHGGQLLRRAAHRHRRRRALRTPRPSALPALGRPLRRAAGHLHPGQRRGRHPAGDRRLLLDGRRAGGAGDQLRRVHELGRAGQRQLAHRRHHHRHLHQRGVLERTPTNPRHPHAQHPQRGHALLAEGAAWASRAAASSSPSPAMALAVSEPNKSGAQRRLPAPQRGAGGGDRHRRARAEPQQRGLVPGGAMRAPRATASSCSRCRWWAPSPRPAPCCATEGLVDDGRLRRPSTPPTG